MTIEEFLRGLEARHPEGCTADEVTEYALEVVNRVENQLHNAQAQITAAREAQKDAERRYGSELITRQRLELELAAIKDGMK